LNSVSNAIACDDAAATGMASAVLFPVSATLSPHGSVIRGICNVNDGFLVRTEWRRDGSNKPFFLGQTVDERKTSQTTATLGLIWWWGNKRGAW